MSRILSLIKAAYAVGITFFFSVLAVLGSLFESRKGVMFDWFAKRWASSLCVPLGIKNPIQGLEVLTEYKESFMVMSNHQSNLDIPSLLRTLPFHLRFVVKMSLTKIPVFGFLMNKYMIGIDRDQGTMGLRSIQTSIQQLRDYRHHILMFPEGTRSADGNLQPLKRGAALLAIQYRLPILPVVIDGGYRLNPKNTSILRSGQIRISVLPPIYPSDPHFISSNVLNNHLQSILQEELNRLRRVQESLNLDSHD